MKLAHRVSDGLVSGQTQGSTLLLDPVAAYRDRCAFTLPSRGDVETAAALFKASPRRSVPLSFVRESRLSPRRFDSPRFFLDVAPGLVQVRQQLMARHDHFGHDGLVVDKPSRWRASQW